jgi:hypothetical protein
LVEYRHIVERTRAAEADGWLSDGTPYFGQLGEVAYDANDDLVQCHLCGEWLKWTGGAHLKHRHAGWTIDTYRQAFGLNGSQVTMASGSRGVLRAIAVQRLKAGQIGSPLGGGAGLQRTEWQSLVDRRPDLASELHPNRNGTLDTTPLWRMVLRARVVALRRVRPRVAGNRHGARCI